MRRLLLGLWLMYAPSSSIAQDREFGAARFTIPAGFTLDARPTVQSWTRINGRDLCMIVVYGNEVSPPGLEAAFAGAWSTIFQPSSYRRADVPSVNAATSPAGYPHAVGEGELEDRGGNRYVARLHVFPVGDRTQSVVLLANSRTAVNGCAGEWSAFFRSLRFPGVQVASADRSLPVPEPPAAGRGRPLPADPAPVPLDRGAPAGSQKFENVTFLPPPGWTVRREGSVVEVAARQMRRDEWVRVIFLQGRPAGASFQSDLAVAWEDMRALLGARLMTSVNGGNYDVEGPSRSLRGWEYVRGNGGLRLPQGPYGLSTNADLYVIRAGSRAVRIAVIAADFPNQSGVRFSAGTSPVFEPAIRQLVFTIRIDGQPEVPLAPARIGSGAISGVWNGISMSFGRLKTHFAIFFDNGLAYFGPGFPRHGLHEIDASVEQPAAQRYWGTYTFSGGRGTLTMPYGTVPLRLDATALVLTTNQTPHRFIRLSMPANPRLDGRWCLASGTCLAFTPAGRFQDGGAALVLAHETYPYPATPAGGEGTYELVEHTLVLRYDGGPEIRIAFPGLPGGPSSPLTNLSLSSNEDVLVRR